MSKSKREKLKLKERRHQKKTETAEAGKAATAVPIKARPAAKAARVMQAAPAGKAATAAMAVQAVPLGERAAEPDAAAAPKRRGRPPGSGAGNGVAKADIAADNRTDTTREAAGTKAATARRGKAATLAAQQAEEEALELQKLTAPHIPDCSPEWRQFYVKVRQAAVTGKYV